MEEVKKEASAEPQGQPSEFVSVSQEGVIALSPEAEAIMEGKEPEVKEPEKKEPEKKEPEKASEKPEEKKRKIKWQGQEVEVEPEKEDELIQKGYDYTQKTQALAAERDMIAPYSGLVKALQEDPGLKKHIADYLKGDTKKEVKPEFDDPIEQLKWETRQETLKEVEERFIKPLQEKTQMVSHEQVIESVRSKVQADPMFKDVDQAMRAYISELPESVGRNLFMQLDQDPKSYLDTYNKLREKIAKQKTSEAKPEVKDEKLPDPVKRETHAPLLEGADKGTSESATKAMNDKIKALIKRSKSGDFAATGELLELM